MTSEFPVQQSTSLVKNFKSCTLIPCQDVGHPASKDVSYSLHNRNGDSPESPSPCIIINTTMIIISTMMVMMMTRIMMKMMITMIVMNDYDDTNLE